MKRMFPSEALEQVYEKGVWEIPSGSIDFSKTLKNLEIGYQYKIYLNVKSDSEYPTRFQTEIGVDKSFLVFIEDDGELNFKVEGTIGGVNNYYLSLFQVDDVYFQSNLEFKGTTTEKVYFRYLITRSKIYW